MTGDGFNRVLDRGSGYALAGQVPAERLQLLARSAYQQLQDVTR